MWIAAWIIFFILLFAGCVLILLSALAKGMSSLSVPQMIYLIYVFGVMAFGLAFEAIPPWAVLAVVLGTPLSAVLVGHARGRSTESFHRDDLAEQIRQRRAFYEQHPTDGATLAKLGEIYEGLGDLVLAARYYEQALLPYPDKPFLRDPIERRLTAVRRVGAPLVAPREARYGALCACPDCGEVNFRRDAVCRRCGRPIFPTGLAGLWQALREFLEGDMMLAVASCGVALLPFLFFLGELPYDLLWAVWSVAAWLMLRTERADKRGKA